MSDQVKFSKEEAEALSRAFREADGEYVPEPAPVDPVEAILAVECPGCRAAPWYWCHKTDAGNLLMCGSRIRASRTTTKADKDG